MSAEQQPVPDTAHFDPLMHVAQPDHPDAMAEARARAGRAVRDIGHALVGHHGSLGLLDEVTRSLDDLSARLAQGAPRSRADTRREAQWDDPPADGERFPTFDERPVSGRASPWGLDIDVRRDGDGVIATLVLRAGHEGAPGRSHGGIVAALFDDVYGFVLNILQQPAFTGELGIRYESAVPIGVPLECRVRLAARERRKLYMTGELTTATGAVLARSTATFISIDPTAFRAGAGGTA